MDRDERISVIRAIFACEHAEAEKLSDALRLIEAEPAQTIAFQGDHAEHCQFVVSGTVGLHALGSEGQFTQVATVEPGEVFGAFPDPAPHGVEVVAQKAVQMLVIGTHQLRELSRNHAAVASGLAGLYAAQLRNVIGRLAARVTLSAKGRVYSELLTLSGEKGMISPAPVVTALAVKAQTTRETASRAVSYLEKRGILERDGNQWRVTSPRMLEELVI